MLGCMNENQILAANCFDGEAQSDWYVAVDVVDVQILCRVVI